MKKMQKVIFGTVICSNEHRRRRVARRRHRRDRRRGRCREPVHVMSQYHLPAAFTDQSGADDESAMCI